MTTSTPGRFTFLVHPFAPLRHGMGILNGPKARLVPSRVYQAAFAVLPLPAWQVARVSTTDAPGELLGDVTSVALSPGQLLGPRRSMVQARITRAVEAARDAGSTIVGLGALTAPATAGGQSLRDVEGVGITNGNAYTAVETAAAVRRLARPGEQVALVGATGSVGSAVARLLARQHQWPLLLIGRTPANLSALAGDLPGAVTSTDLADARRARLVVLLTSGAGAILRSEHLARGAVVLDDTQPRNTSPSLARERPDVTILDGGLLRTPGLVRTGSSLMLPSPSVSYACLAESALLALAGHTGHGTIGQPTLEQCDRLQAIAQRFGHLGFDLAPFTSFGAPVGQDVVVGA